MKSMNLRNITPEDLVSNIAAVSGEAVSPPAAHQQPASTAELSLHRAREKLAVAWASIKEGRKLTAGASNVEKLSGLVTFKRTRTHDQSLTALEIIVDVVDNLVHVMRQSECGVSDLSACITKLDGLLADGLRRVSNLECFGHNAGQALAAIQDQLGELSRQFTVLSEELFSSRHLESLGREKLESVVAEQQEKLNLSIELERKLACDLRQKLDSNIQEHLTKLESTHEVWREKIAGDIHSALSSELVDRVTCSLEIQRKHDLEMFGNMNARIEEHLVRLQSTHEQWQLKVAGEANLSLSTELIPVKDATAGLQARMSAQENHGHNVGLHFRALDRSLTTLGDRLTRIESSAGRTLLIGNDRVIIKTVFGASVVMSSHDMSLMPPLADTGMWEPAQTALITTRLKPGQVFCDIGANVGYFTVLANSLVGNSGQVFAFEANPETCELLRDTLRLNNHGHVCRVFNVALADARREQTFYTFKRNQASATLSSLPEALLRSFQEEPSAIAVKTEPFSEDYFPAGTLVDAMKIDIEGAEGLLFRGAKAAFARILRPGGWVLVEYNPTALSGCGTTGLDFISLLREIGFVIKYLLDNEFTLLTDDTVLDGWNNSDLLLEVPENGLTGL